MKKILGLTLAVFGFSVFLTSFNAAAFMDTSTFADSSNTSSVNEPNPLVGGTTEVDLPACSSSNCLKNGSPISGKRCYNGPNDESKLCTIWYQEIYPFGTQMDVNQAYEI